MCPPETLRYDSDHGANRELAGAIRIRRLELPVSPTINRTTERRRYAGGGVPAARPRRPPAAQRNVATANHRCLGDAGQSIAGASAPIAGASAPIAGASERIAGASESIAGASES